MIKSIIYRLPIILILLLIGCDKQDIDYNNATYSNEDIDYSDAAMWYNYGNEETKGVDIFYIIPTTILDWEDADGNIQHNANVTDPTQQETMVSSFDIAGEIFSGEGNMYAPYYRQVSLESWMENDSTLEARFEIAIQDVKAAFNYFMEYKNEGRPFIIAGFSQGAKCVKELLKILTDEQYSRLIAAYAIGFYITEQELTEYKTIKPAEGATDIGVTISYNSADSFDNICSAIKRTEVCINPVNWHTDTTPAMLNDTVSATIDTANNIVILSGLDPNECFLADFPELFPLGCYHLLELTIYKDYLKQNVIDRVSEYNKK